jgi:hypothetical protein
MNADGWTPWLVLLGSLVALVGGLWVGERVVRWAVAIEARQKANYERRRRPSGSMLGLQELVEPRIEHVIGTVGERPADERDDDQGEGGPRLAPYNLGDRGMPPDRRPVD